MRLTGRGVVFLMFAVFTMGLLGASWLGWTPLTGVAFLAGSAAAARYARPAALPVVAVSPPLVFFCSLALVKALTSSGHVLLSLAEGITLTLAATAPWLFAGTGLCLIIACSRGLPRSVRELRRELGR